jgi:hypothetical protein
LFCAINRVTPKAYQEAGNYLRKAAKVMAAEGKKEAWDTYLQHLRKQHVRKIRLMEVLDSLDNKPITKENTEMMVSPKVNPRLLCRLYVPISTIAGCTSRADSGGVVETPRWGCPLPWCRLLRVNTWAICPCALMRHQIAWVGLAG